ncbi:MAG: sulfatase-like hydrolase/transferase [Chloroflexota bacterium]
MRSRQPNILLIFVDNQPASMMGCYGNDEVFTPHLDKLATKGVVFHNAFSPNSMCSPCRASMLTGLMPSQHGIHTWLDDEIMDQWPENYNAIAEFETLPELLAEAGYHTGLIGKYHLGFADKPQNGFKHWVTMAKGMMDSFYGVEMNDNGQISTAAEHSVDYFTRKAVEYLDDQAGPGQPPFFLFLTYNAPYGELYRSEPEHRFSHLYKDLPLDSVPREGLCPELIDWILIRKEKLPDYDFDWYKELAEMPNNLFYMRQFYSQMSMVDDGVGQVLAKLKEKGALDDTLIIYTADHGVSLGQHGFWGHGEDTWPSNMHRSANNIPLIISHPKLTEAGKEVENLVGTTDIFATILDAASCKHKSPESVPGTSLSPLLRGKSNDFRDEVFMEQEETRAIRTSRWLFMRRIENTPYDFKHALYDLKSDPDERTNLAQDPAYTNVAAALTTRLDAFFTTYANPQWDLWQGGSVKSNSTRPFLWQELWGEAWTPAY